MSKLTEEEKKVVLKMVDLAIQHGLEHREPLRVNPQDFPENLRKQCACFVTLETNGTLRGCIGSLVACQPLIEDLVNNAHAAAFCDPRFFPLTRAEYSQISKHISLLSKPEPMHFTSEQDLLRQLRPGVDGLILSDKGYRGTFLPSVWETLPTPELFLKHLKQKAGLPMDYWSDTISVERYTAEVIE